MKIKTSIYTDIGKKRVKNQDNFYINRLINSNFKSKISRTFIAQKHDVTFMVCDGMGGEKHGEIASMVTAKLFGKFIGKKKNFFCDFDNSATQFVKKANDSICKLIRENNNTRMGSTIAMVSISPQRENLILANVGDTKVFLYREGHIEKLSEDHNEAQSLVNMGLITEEEARTHKDKSKLTQHLGIFSDELILEPYISEYIPIKKKDILLVCSDGLTDMLSYNEIEEILNKNIRLKQKNKLLITKANEAGGKDNITVILAEAI